MIVFSDTPKNSPISGDDISFKIVECDDLAVPLLQLGKQLFNEIALCLSSRFRLFCGNIFGVRLCLYFRDVGFLQRFRLNPIFSEPCDAASMRNLMEPSCELRWVFQGVEFLMDLQKSFLHNIFGNLKNRQLFAIRMYGFAASTFLPNLQRHSDRR